MQKIKYVENHSMLSKYQFTKSWFSYCTLVAHVIGFDVGFEVWYSEIDILKLKALIEEILKSD